MCLCCLKERRTAPASLRVVLWWLKAQDQVWFSQRTRHLMRQTRSYAFPLQFEKGNVFFQVKSSIHALCITLQLPQMLFQRLSDQNEGKGDLFHEWTKMECFHFQWDLSQVNISRSKLVLKLNYSYLLEHSREWL